MVFCYWFMLENHQAADREDNQSQGGGNSWKVRRCEKFICLDRTFGGNDQLKTNTALQMEAEGIEFKVI